MLACGQQRGGLARIVRQQADADGGADHQFLAGDIHRLADASQ